MGDDRNIANAVLIWTILSAKVHKMQSSIDCSLNKHYSNILANKIHLTRP